MPNKNNSQPSAKDVNNFKAKFINEEEIEQSLSEIYQDDEGRLVDVKKIERKRRLGIALWFPLLVFLLTFLMGLGWFYYERTAGAGKTSQVRLNIETDKDAVAAGQPFTYTITIINLGGISLRQAQLQISYPQNFVVLDTAPKPQIASSSANNVWPLGRLGGYSTYKIKVKGALVGEVGKTNTILAQLTYQPANFSSIFKKSASLDVLINQPGLDVSLSAPSVALIGEENEVGVHFSLLADNSIINSCQLTVEAQPQQAVGFVSKPSDSENDFYTRSSLKPNVWHIHRITTQEAELPVSFVVPGQTADKISLSFIFTYVSETGQQYNFLKKTVEFEVMKSDLNLSLFINGSKADQGVNIGDRLHYSIFYNNKGDANLEDVVIMAVIDGPVDWSTLDDPNVGVTKDNTITWTKEQIPSLAVVVPGSEGEINFSLSVASSSALSQKAEIKSYAQYTVGSSSKETAATSSNRSNIIVNKINSTLNFNQKVLYFNQDNITLGSGPIPPQVGATTTYRVFWQLGGNIHELDKVKAEVKLPPYVLWADKAQTQAGDISFDAENQAVVWQVGKLPVLDKEITAEFSISILPRPEDRDKILVLLPPAQATAQDTVTETEIIVNTKAKTTKLEDDEIAVSDGRVR